MNDIPNLRSNTEKDTDSSPARGKCMNSPVQQALDKLASLGIEVSLVYGPGKENNSHLWSIKTSLSDEFYLANSPEHAIEIINDIANIEH